MGVRGRAAAAAAGLLFALPLLFLLTGSFAPVGAPPPTGFSLVRTPLSPSNYPDVLDLVPLARYGLNSLLVAVVAVPLGLVVASWAGFAIAMLPRPSAIALAAICVVVLMIPVTALLMGRVVVFRALGIQGGLVPLMVHGLIGISPLFVLWFAWAYRRVPVELYDAARETGASPVEVWRRVAVPMTRGVTAAAAVLMFVLVWGDAIGPLVYVTDERWYTMSLGLRSLAVLDAPRQPLMLAGAVIATAVAVLSLVFLRQPRKAS